METAKLRPPSYEERLLLLGSNGSGKSVLARELLGAGYKRTIAIDVKGDFEPLQDHALVRDPPWENSRAWRAEHVVYRPRSQYADGRPLDRVLHWIFQRAVREFDDRKQRPRRPCIVYIDESLKLARGGHVTGMAELAVTGRSLGIGLWVASQRPKWIPVEVRSEAWRWYVFYLSYEEDEKEVLKYAKRQITLEQLQEGFSNYSFWELRRGVDSAGHLQVHHFPPVTPSNRLGGNR